MELPHLGRNCALSSCNQLDFLPHLCSCCHLYFCEEHKDKVDPTTIEAIELAIAALKDDLETDNADKIKSGIQNVTEAAMKLGEAIYKSSQEGGDDDPVAADERTPGEDDILDADFEDIDTNKRS